MNKKADSLTSPRRKTMARVKKIRSSIGKKTAILAWMIALVTLILFMVGTIPSQLRTYQENLESKAHAVMASVHHVAAGALISEDFSRVIDHCLNVLQEDHSIAYLILTKNDGFSIICRASSIEDDERLFQWRAEPLGVEWHPRVRRITSRIGEVPLIGERVFNYSAPFDYSGMEWGWIHVGLVLDHYDRSVHDVVVRTGLLAAACLFFGFICSVLYARRIVTPVLKLKQTVQAVAAGDLAARVHINSGDEVEELGTAFNAMTQAVEQRQLRLQAQNEAMSRLAGEESLHAGELAVAARVITEQAAAVLQCQQAGIWLLNDDESELYSLDCFDAEFWRHSSGQILRAADEPEVFAVLQQKALICLDDAQSDERLKSLMRAGLLPRGVMSLLAAPIRRDGRVIGLLVLLQLDEAREWALEEQNCVQALSDTVTLAIEAKGRRLAHEQLQIAKEAAEDANQAKSQFLANMSHEIRTPMNAILGMTRALRDTPLNAEQADYNQMVLDSAGILLHLINDILDLSKLSAGKMCYEQVVFNVQELLETTVETLAVVAHEKGIECVARMTPGVPLQLVGDPGRLRQVLINLIGNAVKFTSQGSICVLISRIENGQRGAELCFAVQDSGIGIPKDKLDAVFNVFEQVDSSDTRRFGGTGLGLALCRELVEGMGGMISVESTLGVGSIFRFTLPLKTPAGALGAEAVAVPAYLQGRRVLVVDDHPENLQGLQDRLYGLGMESDVLAGSEQVLQQMHAHAVAGTPYDLVVLDADLPGQDGFTLGQAIRSDATLQNTRLLLLSMKRLPTVERARRAGCFDWLLVKPVKMNNLRQALQQLFDPNAPPIHLQPEDESGRKEDAGFDQVKVLVAEDNEANMRVITLNLEKYGMQVDRAADGAQALQAFEAHTYDLIFMDVQMPVLGGLKAVRILRQMERSQAVNRTPVIALTAHAMQGDREKCLQAGMDDYLTKPIEPDELDAMLRRWLSPESSSDCGGGEVEEAQPLQVINRESLLNRTCGMADVADELIAYLAERLPADLQLLRHLIAKKDATAAFALAHQLKGASASTSAELLCRDISLLTIACQQGEWLQAEQLLPMLEERVAELNSI